MTLVNGHWTDGNNNSWNSDFYTQEQAEKYSESLVNCSDCRNCSYCFNCSYCRNCSGCSGCSDCSNYADNPLRYTTGRIGEHNDNTTIYYLDGKTQIVCWDFRGNLDEFEEHVRKTHKDNDTYREQYLAEIAKARVLFELE